MSKAQGIIRGIAYGTENIGGDSICLQARVVAEVGRILDVAARQANACRDAADQLAYLHGELEDTRVPAYDVPTALEVLQTGMLTRIEGVWSQKCSPKPMAWKF